jgi:hypothetical protein
MNTRNRSEGWTHAKLSGHNNEEIISTKINTDNNYRKILENRIGVKNKIAKALVGGLNEASVSDIFGRKTKSKTDLIVVWCDEKKSNVSIKKSTGGQVYLIGVTRFIDGYEAQFKQKIDPKIKRALELFFGSAYDILEILNSEKLKNISTEKIKNYEIKKNRLTWVSLGKYEPGLPGELIDWFKVNIKNIVYFCFSRGLALNCYDWAHYMWYKNEVGEAVDDRLFEINGMANDLSSPAAQFEIMPGKIGGGTTIKLPFGFVQWHQGQMQFHHSQEKILAHCKWL